MGRPIDRIERNKKPDPPRLVAGPSRPTSSQLAADLGELLTAHAGERHVVAIQDFPDPDAISSALAYQEIARGFDITADILYEGLISHPENLALVNLLEIDMTRHVDGMPLEGYDGAIFVDNQGTTTRLTNRLKDRGIRTLAVIDHHDPQGILDPVFSDIRPVGAAATQFAEYLESGLLMQLDRKNDRHVRVATALLHGLHSETSSFIYAGKPEYDAAAFLSYYADQELLERVLCVQKSRGTMETIEAALGQRIIRGGVSVSGVGAVRWADRDAIPQAADFLLKEENVHTAVVYGLVTAGDGTESIFGSLRTTNATLGVDAFLKQALGRDVTGRYYGGGRSRAGGFEIRLEFLSGGSEDNEEREAKWSLYDRQIRRMIFEAAGLEATADGNPRTPGGGP